MADDQTDNQETLIKNALNVLGHPTSLSLTGSSSLPAGAPIGLPAPSGVSGTGGFMGGGLGAGAGAGGAGAGGGNLLGLARNALEAGSKIANLFGGQSTDQTRGDTGGVSLSDRLRSGDTTQPVTVSAEQIFGGIDANPWAPTTVDPSQIFEGIDATGGGGGSLGAGTVGTTLGGLGSAVGLGQDISQGNVGGAAGDVLGVANSAAELSNALFGTSLPTVGSSVASGLNALTSAGLSGAETTLGATGSELGSALASGALEGGTAAAEGAAIPAASAGLGAVSAIAAPFVIAAMHGLMDTFQGTNTKGDALSDLSFGAFGSEGGGWLGGLFGGTPMPPKLQEILGARKDYASQLPIYAAGLSLPQEFAALNMNAPPEQLIPQLIGLNTTAQNIMNQGPVMSRAQGKQGASAGIDPAFLNENSSQIAENAIATTTRTQEMLAKLGVTYDPQASQWILPDGQRMAGITNPNPLEFAQWAGNYGGLAAGQNPAYGTEIPSEFGPGFAGTPVAATAAQFGQFANPATLEAELAKFVNAAGGSYDTSALEQVFAGLPQLGQTPAGGVPTPPAPGVAPQPGTPEVLAQAGMDALSGDQGGQGLAGGVFSEEQKQAMGLA
jgi:hypothetical protein